jgi:hypothetical protein
LQVLLPIQPLESRPASIKEPSGQSKDFSTFLKIAANATGGS